MDVLKFFLGSFFTIGGFNIIMFHSHVGRTPGLSILLIVLCIINSFLAGAFFLIALSINLIIANFIGL